MIRKIVTGLVLVVAVLFFGVLFYLYSTTPDYYGEIESPVSNETDVYFDPYGVPHIYSDSEEDAYFALGYVHAQERLFQMEMIRRVATGRLSEIVGPEFIKTDQFFRSLGLKDIAEKSAAIDMANSESPIAKSANAYQRGINHFIESGNTPPEFSIMGIPMEPFDEMDMYYVAAYLALGFAEGFRTDPALTYVQMKWGENYLDPLAIESIEGTEFLSSYSTQEAVAEIGPYFNKIFDELPIPLFHGSNSWVVGPDKSETGNIIFANDTHIGFSQPAVWYEAHLNYPGKSIYGHFAAGFPFAILGHNSQTAWGMTMLENDDADFYIHSTNPEDSMQIWIDSTWQSMSVTHDTIHIKGEESLIFPIYTTPYGPVINTSLESFPTMIKNPVSVYWTFLQSPSPLLQACYKLATSSSIETIGEAAALIKAPGLNIMGADTSGNYGWFAAAMLNKRSVGTRSKLFLDAKVSSPQGFYESDYNPSAVNSPWGYVYSANNQPDTVRGIFHEGYYMPEDRAEEINTFLKSKDRYSFQDLKDFMLHHKSGKAAEIAALILRLTSDLELSDKEKQMLSLIEEWDGEQSKNSVAPSIYYSLMAEIFHYAMSDEIGRQRLDQMSRLAVLKRSFVKFLSHPNNPWWDDTKTEKIEQREDILHKAISHTYEKLNDNLGSNMSKWEWGELHTLTHPHLLGSVAFLEKFFNVGPFEVDGGIETINNMMFTLSHSDMFDVAAGPSMRRIIDMGDMSNAEGILPTGQSGHFLSPHYQDQAEMFASGEFRNFWTSKEDILNYSDGKLIFVSDGK